MKSILKNGVLTSICTGLTALQPYIKSTQLFQCPSEANGLAAYNDWGYNDYWANRSRLGYISPNSGDTSLSIAAMNSTALVVLVGDGSKNDASGNAIDYGRAAYIFPNDYSKPFPAGNDESQGNWWNRHLAGANYAFADGHVKWLKSDKISINGTASISLNPATQ